MVRAVISFIPYAGNRIHTTMNYTPINHGLAVNRAPQDSKQIPGSFTFVSVALL